MRTCLTSTQAKAATLTSTLTHRRYKSIESCLVSVKVAVVDSDNSQNNGSLSTDYGKSLSLCLGFISSAVNGTFHLPLPV
jgi:hypothetical protein